MNTTQTLTLLKASDQDFEWYPTTDEMIAVIARNIGEPTSIMDIGAGDGRVLTALAGKRLAYTSLYAIEKAPLHLDNMPAHIAIVGTDFEQQTLIDKDVSVVFCNPPYSQYEQWAVKIIKEALCNTVYLVIPNRWAESGPIAAALESRGTKARVLWSGDFTNAERRARATVDILSISLNEADNGYGCRARKKDPFDTWFAETFPEVEKIDHVPEEPPVDVRMNTEIMQGYNPGGSPRHPLQTRPGANESVLSFALRH